MDDGSGRLVEVATIQSRLGYRSDTLTVVIAVSIGTLCDQSRRVPFFNATVVPNSKPRPLWGGHSAGAEEE
jgi:hypothetical protein